MFFVVCRDKRFVFSDFQTQNGKAECELLDSLRNFLRRAVERDVVNVRPYSYVLLFENGSKRNDRQTLRNLKIKNFF